MSSATKILTDAMIAAGMEPGLVVCLVTNATMQWAATPRVRSRHAQAQAKYWAKKRSDMIRYDQNDHSDQQTKEGLQTSKENYNLNIPVTSLHSVTGAEAPSDKSQLYDKGLKILEKITGNAPASLRSLLGRWTKIVDGDYVHVLAAIEDAEREEPVDPRSWIFARLQTISGNRNQLSAKPIPPPISPKRRTIHDQADELLAAAAAVQNQSGNGGTLVWGPDKIIPADQGHVAGTYEGHGRDILTISGKRIEADLQSSDGDGYQF